MVKTPSDAARRVESANLRQVKPPTGQTEATTPPTPTVLSEVAPPSDSVGSGAVEAARSGGIQSIRDNAGWGTLLLRWASWVWFVGTITALLPLVLGTLSLRQLRRSSRPVRDQAILSQMEQAKVALNLGRQIELLESPCRRMPLTWGICAPKVALSLLALNMELVKLEAKDWDLMTPQRLGDLLKDAVLEKRVVHRLEPRPAIGTSFGFRTSDGGIGIFRIAEWTEQMPGVKVELQILRRGDQILHSNLCRTPYVA